MIKHQVLGIPSHENVFIRQALGQGIRLDGRTHNEFREIEVTLNRAETSATATVVIGNTRVFCVVSGEITAPYPDRPTEGAYPLSLTIRTISDRIIQFNAEVSPMAESHGISQVQLSRLLDRSIKESDTIDTESLCIVSGEKVWLISCDVRVLDYSGGNVVDAALFAAMCAFKAFRKPEVSVVSVAGKSSLSVGDLTIHRSDEREPLPLALHHTPLSVTLGLFQGIRKSQDELSGVVLLADPSASEENSMDGSLTFSINAHRELCAIHKPGEVAVTAAVILEAAKRATERAESLHTILKSALLKLENDVIAERTIRLEKIRSQRENIFDFNAQNNRSNGNSGDNMEVIEQTDYDRTGAGGIARDDPMLAWASLHQAAGLREADS